VAPTAQSLHPSPPAALQEPLAQLPLLAEVPLGLQVQSVLPDAERLALQAPLAQVAVALPQSVLQAQPQSAQEDAVLQLSARAALQASEQKAAAPAQVRCSLSALVVAVALKAVESVPSHALAWPMARASRAKSPHEAA
jgi:hypothetical protein